MKMSGRRRYRSRSRSKSPKYRRKKSPEFSTSRNGSLFDVFLATVKENNEENEMSSKFAFSRLKMGEVESRVTLETPKGSKGFTPA